MSSTAAQLACGHWVTIPDPRALPTRRTSNWFAAIRCEVCGRRRAVICMGWSSKSGLTAKDFAR